MSGSQESMVLEAAYRVDASPDGWLASVGAAVRPLIDEGGGACALLYDASAASGHIDLGPLVTLGMDAALPAAMFRPADEEPALADFFRTDGVDSILTAVRHAPLTRDRLRRTLRASGLEDFLCLNSVDGSRRGCSIGAPQPRRRPVSPAMRRLWRRMSSHIATGWRLQRMVPRPAPGVRAEPAVARADAAEIWEGLLSGRWSLVDRFDGGGRRYLLARRNDPAAAGARRLTPRELQVVEQAVLGHAQKVIAYDLGISPAAVSMHLAQAQRKIGAGSRAALIEVLAQATRELAQR